MLKIEVEMESHSFESIDLQIKKIPATRLILTLQKRKKKSNDHNPKSRNELCYPLRDKPHLFLG